MSVAYQQREGMLVDIAHYCSAMITNMCAGLVTKLLASTSIGVLIFFFDTLHKEALTALLVLIAMDSVSAVFAAYKRKEEISSRKFSKTAIKIAVYFTMVSAAFLAEKAVPIGIIDDTVIAFLVLTELISILENAGKAGYAVPSKLLNKLSDIRDDK